MKNVICGKTLKSCQNTNKTEAAGKLQDIYGNKFSSTQKMQLFHFTAFSRVSGRSFLHVIKNPQL